MHLFPANPLPDISLCLASNILHFLNHCTLGMLTNNEFFPWLTHSQTLAELFYKITSHSGVLQRLNVSPLWWLCSLQELLAVLTTFLSCSQWSTWRGTTVPRLDRTTWAASWGASSTRRTSRVGLARRNDAVHLGKKSTEGPETSTTDLWHGTATHRSWASLGRVFANT